MNNQDEDKIINDLYQQGNQEQPPKALDDLILKHAEHSTHQSQQPAAVKSKNNWRPWLAAASVVLVMPLIWLLTQNQELSQDFGQTQSLESKSKEQLETAPSIDNAFADDDIEAYETDDQDFEEQGKITVTGARMRQEPAAAPMPALEEVIGDGVQRSITGKPIDFDSLQANQKILKDELKAKKRTIKPSTMDPLMALEYEQFGRYLERGEFDAADQLLTEMQENWPDFDFEDMIYRLAAAEAAN
jgi:hypothetical protein